MSTKTAPKAQLRLEWVYGYRGYQCRNNIYYTASKECVFFVAGVGVVYNHREHKQKFFLGHDDDIISLALHPARLLVATGQVGKTPYICIWDSMNTQTVSILKDGHTHGVSAMGFDKEGQRLVSVGLDPHATLNIWDWKRGKVLATVRGHNDRVFDAQFHPFMENTIVTCGVKHIKFWTLCGNALSAKKGVFGKVGEIQTMLCLTFGPDNMTYSGTLGGDVYIWKNNTLQSVIEDPHIGALYTLESCAEGYVSGGKDGVIKFWDTDFKPMATVDVGKSRDGYKGLSIRSVSWMGDKALVGTNGGEIFEVAASEREQPQCLLQGHSPGELWGLAMHPKKPLFATGSDDHTVRIWDMQHRSMLSQTSLDHAVRSCAFSPDATQIAAGMKDGSYMVLRTRDLSEIIHIKDRKEVLHEMKFSPDGAYLAVGSNDNFVDIYAVSQKFKKVGQCSGSSSFITHLDWSEDSKYVQTNSGASERLYFRMPTGKQVTKGEEIRSIHWSSWTGVLGDEVNGIWEKYTDTNDVNATDANYGHDTIVTGDDFGLVKLFRFPTLKKGAKFRKYTGHSAHVTNCRFSTDKRRVITTGGGDHSVFQWKFLPDGVDVDDDLADQNGYIDSNSEDSDSDMSEVDSIDSDLENERQKSYKRDVYKDDMKALKAHMKADMRPGGKRAGPPNSSLKLEFVFGYRGYDCRNNLFYIHTGEIVYHVAAVAIVYNRDKHNQRFYTQHTDDILCLTVHPLKDIVATGQVGRDPDCHIWDAETMKTIAILKGQHQRGICAADFSADGKKLATVGLDDNHCIVIWDWKRGEKLASTRGHKDKIFVIAWNPHENNKLISVGVKHIKFWTQAGGGFTSNRGTFGNVGKLDTMTCITFGKKPEICYTGGANGQIYIWNGQTLSKTIKAHEGPCFAMHSLDKGFVTGGKDGTVCLWDETFERCLKSYVLKRSNLTPSTRGTLVKDLPPVRAIVLGHGHILVGTQNGEVIEVAKEGPMNVLVQGHKEGELWGLSPHPSKPICATVSDDKTLRLWDLTQLKMMNSKVMKQPARCVAFSPDGKALAIGMKDGSFAVLNTDTLEDIAHFHHRKQEISDIKFSPEPGKYLAVASHDNMVDIYNVLQSKRVGVCKGNSSYVTHIDWDAKGKLLMTNSGDKAQLFFEAPRGKRQTLRNAEIEKTNWATWTSVLGVTCEGVWPPKCDVTDVNASSVSADRRLIATGDDFGFVKLFQYPAMGQFSKFKKYLGHSAHVTNVRWSSGDNYLLSTGGADTALMLWKHDGAGGAGDSDDSDSDEEDGGYDSDVAFEIKLDYSTKIYTKPIRRRQGVKPHQREYDDDDDKPSVSRHSKSAPKVRNDRRIENTSKGGGKGKKLAQVKELELDCIYGYRGFDCRSNLQYLNDGTDIVYHAAGCGIVLNLSSGNQSFYTEHTDDIICLAVNEHPKFRNVVATGQIGAQAEVHVWDVATKRSLSIMKGLHSHGVCAVDFSCSGKFLLSVGLEDNHSVAVWRWQEGSKMATAPASSSRIFQAEFRPDSDSHFVTVGVKHVKFWTIAGNQLVGKKGVIGHIENVATQPQMQTMLSIAFSANNITYTGAMSGDVYIWKENKLTRVVPRAHNGPVFSMYTTLRDGLVVTGGKEKRGGDVVKLWDQDMKRSRAFPLNSGRKKDVVKSVCRHKGKILVGTKENEIYDINEKTGSVTMVTCGHGEGELWGLDTHPSSEQFVTASDDGSVRMWDIVNKRMLQRFDVGAARSVDISGNGEFIAVGLKSGGFVILNAETFKPWAQKRDRGKMINDIRFSPNDQFLSVGSEDGVVDIYDLRQGAALPRAGCCKGISSFVVKLDFSEDSKYLRVCTGDYVHQYFSMPKGGEVTDKRATANLTMSSWTSALGSEMVGVWPQNSDKADVNCAHVSNAGNSVATGDDFGLVKIFQFPCSQKLSTHKTYVGHSAHVTNVRFTHTDRYLISAGGDDCCVFVWKCK